MSDNIPFDIQVEIMKRLPVKSLIQFRSLSKQWKSLIDSSEFITDHSVNQTQPHHLLVVGKLAYYGHQYVSIVDDNNESLSFPHHKFSPTLSPTLELFYRVFMVDSSHGLVCVYGSFPGSKNLILLWNPSIRKSVGILLPLESIVGFGVCPKTSEPKIVKITRMDNWQAEVFTLSSRTWTSVQVNLPLSLQLFQYQCYHIVVDGVIYWHAYDLITKNYNRIVSFDLTSEEFGEVRLPDCLGSHKILTISKVKESLVVVTRLYQEDSWLTDLYVWTMKKKSGDPKSLLAKLCFIIKAPDCNKILGFRKNGSPIMEHLYHTFDDIFLHDMCVLSRLSVYDPSSKQVNDLGIDRSFSPFKMTSYSESLLLLNHPDPDDHSIIQS